MDDKQGHPIQCVQGVLDIACSSYYKFDILTVDQWDPKKDHINHYNDKEVR